MLLGSIAGKNAGQAHFTDGQVKDENFKNVAKAWTAQCVSYDKGIEKLAESQSLIQDLRTPFKEWQADLDNEGKFVLLHKPSLQTFKPTEKAIADLARLGKTSQWFIDDMLGPKKNDAIDNDIIRRTIQNTVFNPDRVDQNDLMLFRTWKDGSLRAVLSNRYAIVNNVWFMELMKKLIPGGLLSHWRGDADTVLGNILIPDSIRQFGVDEFGTMLSVGNSEIGVRRVYTLPSAFRRICQNGCIWEQEKGKAVNRRHVGKEGGIINLEDLAGQIAENLQNAIPLANDIINHIIGCRVFKFDVKLTVPVIAELFSEFNLGENLAVPYFTALNKELECGTENDNLFFLMQGITRMSQTLDNNLWVKLDMLAGEMSKMTEKKWKSICSRAEDLTAKEIEKSLGDIAHLA